MSFYRETDYFKKKGSFTGLERCENTLVIHLDFGPEIKGPTSCVEGIEAGSQTVVQPILVLRY